MPANVQELRRRIKATKSIKQITKAMEMIAASKMRKAQQAALRSRPYADLAWEMVSAITATPEEEDGVEQEAVTHPLLIQPKREQASLTLVIAPNRGLCGSLPTQIIAAALKDTEGVAQRYVTVGRKAERALLKANANIVAHFDGFESQPHAADVRPITDIVRDSFLNGEVDAVYAVYADFVSTLEYKVKRVRILPIGERDADIGDVMPHDRRTEKAKAAPEQIDFLFEPTPEDVLESLLPRLLELTVYQVMLEALASEHSSRMVTMQNASGAADDLIDEFTLTYNSARQAAITAEIAEITGGRLALAS